VATGLAVDPFSHHWYLTIWNGPQN